MVGDAVAGAVGLLAYQLIEPLAGHRPVAVFIGVAAMVGAGRRAVDRDLEAHRLAVGTRPQHQVQVAAWKR